MAKNPVEDFLEKKAFNPFSAMAKSPGLARFGQKASEGLMTGGAMALSTAGVAGVITAASKLYDAATKKHDFDRMMQANPHLGVHHEQDPESFNRMFSSIRRMSPEFTKDPVVAGAFMSEAMEQSPEDRGFVAVKALRETQPQRFGPVTEAALGGFQRGAGMDLYGTPKDPRYQADTGDQRGGSQQMQLPFRGPKGP